jgi:hypothetical protein
MTTTITVKTHDWPVDISTTDHAVEGDDTVTTEQVAPHSEHTVHINATRSVSFKELPAPASEPASVA